VHPCQDAQAACEFINITKLLPRRQGLGRVSITKSILQKQGREWVLLSLHRPDSQLRVSGWTEIWVLGFWTRVSGIWPRPTKNLRSTLIALLGLNLASSCAEGLRLTPPGARPRSWLYRHSQRACSCIIGSVIRWARKSPRLGALVGGFVRPPTFRHVRLHCPTGGHSLLSQSSYCCRTMTLTDFTSSLPPGDSPPPSVPASYPKMHGLKYRAQSNRIRL
jgi:hypothetical protein